MTILEDAAAELYEIARDLYEDDAERVLAVRKKLLTAAASAAIQPPAREQFIDPTDPRFDPTAECVCDRVITTEDFCPAHPEGS